MSETLLPLFGIIHDLDEPFVFIFLIGTITLVLGVYRRSHALGFFATIALTFMVTNVAKHIFAIPRPEYMILVADGYRFPSMHAAITGAIAGSLWYFAMMYFTRKLTRALATLVLLTILLLVAVSRVSLNVHEPIDVIVGSMIGAGLAFAINRFVDRRTNLLK